jgi:hypothetical protein
MIRLKEKGTTLTWGPGPSNDPGSEVITAPATAAIVAAAAVAVVAAVLLVVFLGVITPRWWWWRRDRRTDAPLRAVGLGAGLLGPTSSPLALLGGLQNERPVSVTQPASPLLLRPPGATWGGSTGEGTACSPFALVQGAGGHSGSGAASHTGGLGTSSRRIGDPDPAVGVPAAGLANHHATLVEGR